MTPNSSAAGNTLPAADAVKSGDAGSEITGDGSDCTPTSKSAEQSTSEPPSAATQGYRASDPSPASPQVHSQIYQQQAYVPHLTPQPGQGYYLYGNPQVTPEPQSPAAQVYDMNTFLQQQAALGVHPGNPFGNSGQYGMPQAPLSPSRTGGLIPPPSPLFPRPTGTHMPGSFDPQSQLDSSVLRGIQGQTPQSPSGTFMSPALGPSNVPGFSGAYSGYPAATGIGTYATVLNGAADAAGSPDEKGWGERNNMQPPYAQASNRIVPGLPGGYPGMGRAASGNRSYSFDEMLPPAVLDPQDQASAPYSPYSNTQIAPGNAQFAHQQQWGYGISPGDMYNPPQSPLQQRQSPHMQNHFPGAHGGMGPPPMHMGPYAGQQPMPPYYPATSPGPPIQTTASNKGPDGANLFIFHIPNHFTNLDMYRLFCQYGNLLSVRIMVEKDTGRSRGFGFVSYDSPESAALAIKELNGFAIGNKRLKVQHKQIRGDQHRNNSFGSPTHSGDPTFMPRQDVPSEAAPQQGMGISSTPWYDATTNPPQPAGTLLGEGGQDINRDEVVVGDLDEGAVGNGTPLLPSIGTEQQVAQPVDLSPLASLEPLRNALPDVAGHVGTVE